MTSLGLSNLSNRVLHLESKATLCQELTKIKNCWKWLYFYFRPKTQNINNLEGASMVSAKVLSISTSFYSGQSPFLSSLALTGILSRPPPLTHTHTHTYTHKIFLDHLSKQTIGKDVQKAGHQVFTIHWPHYKLHSIQYMLYILENL